MYGVFGIHFLASTTSSFPMSARSSRGGEIPEFASRDLACLDYQNNLQHIHTAPLAQHLLSQMHSMSITPECYSGILVKNTPSFRKGLGVGYICRFLRFTFSFTPLIPCLLPPRDEREKTERTTAQLPANKKCCLLIFAIAIDCLVVADFPVVNFSTRSQFLPTQDYLFLFYFVSIASISSIASMFSCYWFSDCDSACEKIPDFTQKIKFSSKKVHFSDMCKQIFRQRRLTCSLAKVCKKIGCPLRQPIESYRLV